MKVVVNRYYSVEFFCDLPKVALAYKNFTLWNGNKKSIAGHAYHPAIDPIQTKASCRNARKDYLCLMVFHNDEQLFKLG